MTEKFPSDEYSNSAEVFTDDAEFISQSSSEDSVVAYTISCGVLTLDHRPSKTVGMIHVSEGNFARDVIEIASQKASTSGLKLQDFALRRFKGTETIWEDTKEALKTLEINLPDWEDTMEPGIKIHKDTGEVTFFV